MRPFPIIDLPNKKSLDGSVFVLFVIVCVRVREWVRRCARGVSNQQGNLCSTVKGLYNRLHCMPMSVFLTLWYLTTQWSCGGHKTNSRMKLNINRNTVCAFVSIKLFQIFVSC